MAKIVLHVGMPKCGSSALQAYLSSAAFHDLVGNSHAYVAIVANGSVYCGEPLINRAQKSPTKYFASANVVDFMKLDKALILPQIHQLARQYETLILSCEGWGQTAQLFEKDNLFADPSLDVSVVAYVRPQLDWHNSAWWQWGAWSDQSFTAWTEQMKHLVEWYRLLQEWAALPWVQKLDIRVLQGDISKDFVSLLGYDIPEQPRTNESLPGSILRVMQRNRELRPGMHDSVIDFVLPLRMGLTGGKTPWVIPPSLAEQLIEFYRHDNESLRDYLTPDQRELMCAEPRWWSAEAYADKRCSSPDISDVDPAELERLLVLSLKTIMRMDVQIRHPPGKKHNQNK